MSVSSATVNSNKKQDNKQMRGFRDKNHAEGLLAVGFTRFI